MSGDGRRGLGLVLVALLVGLAVWAVGRLRPGVDGELARNGGTVVPIVFDREPAVQAELEVIARRLGAGAEVQFVDGSPALLLPAGLEPDPGFRPPQRLDDGRRLYRPTPDRAERWRKRAFNGLVERLDARLESLPRGRGQATLPGAGELQLELTLDTPLDWLPAVLEPGRLELWRGDAQVADPLDVVGVVLHGDRIELALRADAHPGPGSLEARLDDVPLARGQVTAKGMIELPLLPGLGETTRAQAGMKLETGPLPLPARAGPIRRLHGPRWGPPQSAAE